MNPTKQYDKIGKEYIKYKDKFFENKPDLAKEFILKQINTITGKTLLDVGCGSGTDLKTYLTLGADCYGIDPSKLMIGEAKKKTGLGNKLKVEGVESISFEPDTFDLVVGRFSLHYLKNMNKAYVALNRVMKKKGQGVFVVDHPLRSQALKKDKTYSKQELITIHLYENKVPLIFPSHTFTDYFSEKFFKYFKIDFFYEEMRETGGEREQAHIPSFLGFVFSKK